MTPLGIISRELDRLVYDAHSPPDRVHLVALSASLHTNTDHERRPDMLLITAEDFPCVDVDNAGYFVERLRGVRNPNADPMPTPALPHPYANNPHYQLPWVDTTVNLRVVVTGTAYTNVNAHTLASIVPLDMSAIAVAVDYELYHTTRMLHSKNEVHDWWMHQALPDTVIYRIEKYASSRVDPPAPGYQLLPRVEASRDPVNALEFSNRHLHLWHPYVENTSPRFNLLPWIRTASMSTGRLSHLHNRTNAASTHQLPRDLMFGLLAEPHYPLLRDVSASDTGPKPYEVVTLSGTSRPSPRLGFVLELMEHFPEETVAQRMERLRSGKLSYTGHGRDVPYAVMVANTQPNRTVVTGPTYLDLVSPLYTSVRDIPLEFVELIIYSLWQT
jgi:hypothetical protein